MPKRYVVTLDPSERETLSMITQKELHRSQKVFSARKVDQGKRRFVEEGMGRRWGRARIIGKSTSARPTRCRQDPPGGGQPQYPPSGALSETFSPDKALLDCFEFVYPPKHGSWLGPPVPQPLNRFH